MNQLTEAELDRLVKLLGSFPATRLANGRPLAPWRGSSSAERKLSWADVMRPRSAEPPPLPAPGSGWRRIARECLDFHEAFGGLSGWETGFLCRIAAYKQKPSEKQLEILRRIAAGLGVGPQ